VYSSTKKLGYEPSKKEDKCIGVVSAFIKQVDKENGA
jgi:hypothetical protein